MLIQQVQQVKMNNLNLPEQGYTPDNYKALVKLTNLTNADFCREFDISEQTFYKHRLGSRTMKWKEWQSLYNAVVDFNKKLG